MYDNDYNYLMHCVSIILSDSGSVMSDDIAAAFLRF